MTRLQQTNIPTVAHAVGEFLERERVAGKKAIPDLQSVLHGPNARVVGKTAAGPALARSELGHLSCNRLTAPMITRWFSQRCPTHLAPATRKRSMSAVRGFLTYAVSQGYCDSNVLAACVSIADSPPRREWLTPEQVLAISDLLENPDEFDDYERFAISLLRDTGVRAEEAVTCQRSSLDINRRVLHVVGKGRGAGKAREIPVDDDFIELWNAHAERFALRPNDWMLFSRYSRFVGGSTSEQEWIVDKKRHTGQKPLRRIAHKLGELARTQLSLDVAPSFELTPKVFRRTYACTHVILHAMGLGGLDLVSLQEAMGHEGLETTEVYLSDVRSYLTRVRRPTNVQAGALQIVEAQHADIEAKRAGKLPD